MSGKAIISTIVGTFAGAVGSIGGAVSGSCIIPVLVGSFGIACVCDYVISDKKIGGDSTPSTVSNKEGQEISGMPAHSWSASRHESNQPQVKTETEA